MKAFHELSHVITALSTLAVLHRDAQGTLHRPRGENWEILTTCMRRLLVLRGLIPVGETRLPGDPWGLFLDEFGPQEEPLRVAEAVTVTTSILVSPVSVEGASSGGGAPVVAQEVQVERHVRFAPQEQTRRDGGSRSIPRWVS